MSLAQLKQLYYSLVHPYISYAILAWGSGPRTQIKKVQTKQNTVIRTIFFATSHGKNTESALPLMNLLDILSVTSIFNSFPTYVAQWSFCGPPWESVTKNLRYFRFPPNLDSVMISSLANYRPFFSSFPHTLPSGEFCQVS